MNQKQWHLDCKFPQELFKNNWPELSTSDLYALFKYFDKQEKPILSMLPPNVTPAGAAAMAALYFLPGIQDAPKPHCRIALYPGHHFLKDLRQIKFGLKRLYVATQSARCMMRGSSRLNGPIDRMRRILQDKSTSDDMIHFHWIWGCQRIWTRYGQIETEVIKPRSYYGADDIYEPTIDLIESEKPELISQELGSYDLLIYCPYYHSGSFHENENNLERASRIIGNFKADRKLIISRSPYDYWSKRLETLVDDTGIFFLAPSRSTVSSDSILEFNIVEQIINLQESYELHSAVKEAKRQGKADSLVFSELRYVLRYLLIGLDPYRDSEILNEHIIKLNALGQSLGFTDDTKAGRLISEIGIRVRNGAFTKKQFLNSFLKPNHEVWTTKDTDKRILLDLKTDLSLNFSIQNVKRSIPTHGSESSTVILTRIDSESDLDLVSYLQKGDVVVMSAWEAVIRAETIDNAWERSERWRVAAIQKLSFNSTGEFSDPVLELADFLGSKTSVFIGSSQDQPLEGIKTWWDEETAIILGSNISRDLMLSSGSDAVPCIEIVLEGGFGMFLRKNSDVQILYAKEDENNEFISTPATQLKEDDILLVFKDSERDSIFDILIDQLEESEQYSEAAKLVKNWKEKLRGNFLKSKLGISAVQDMFANRQKFIDAVTIRSWISGPTMAPQRYENFLTLIEIFNLNEIKAEETFNAVRKLRNVARTTGKALNNIIVKKDLDAVDSQFREVLLAASIDLEEIVSAVDARKIIQVSPSIVNVSAANVKKLFVYKN